MYRFHVCLNVICYNWDTPFQCLHVQWSQYLYLKCSSVCCLPWLHSFPVVIDLIFGQNGERLCNSDFSFLPMPLVSSVKDQPKLSKSLLVGGQCLDRVMFFSKSFHFNDFSLKTKYLMFPYSHFCVKIWNQVSPENSSLAFATPVCHMLCITWLLWNQLYRSVNQIFDNNPLGTWLTNELNGFSQPISIECKMVRRLNQAENCIIENTHCTVFSF